jgi:hypothetical protein
MTRPLFELPHRQNPLFITLRVSLSILCFQATE